MRRKDEELPPAEEDQEPQAEEGDQESPQDHDQVQEEQQEPDEREVDVADNVCDGRITEGRMTDSMSLRENRPARAPTLYNKFRFV